MTTNDHDLMRFRVLAALRSARGWLKRSQLSSGAMRHFDIADRDIVLFTLVREGYIDEAIRRRAYGPGAPARCYKLNNAGRSLHAKLNKTYRKGVYIPS